ncbi:MAG: response regulator transcription factor [Deltaproteobacteria bacterium]|nr:response regulator transcription factor [Deltaproteobacteria bacterium]
MNTEIITKAAFAFILSLLSSLHGNQGSIPNPISLLAKGAQFHCILKSIQGIGVLTNSDRRKTIEAEMFSSKGTVKSHLKKIMQGINVRSGVEIAALLKSNWLCVRWKNEVKSRGIKN